LEDVRVNRGAIVTLGKLGDRRAVVPLLKMLEDRPGEYTVLGALADIGDRRALGPLMGLARKTLTKQIQGDLLNTTRALARLADGSVTPLLIQLSKHPDGAVRQVAAEGLGRVGDKEAVARLREMLKHEKDKDAKTGAITGLATCDTEQTVRMLSEELKALTDWELAGERNMAYVREAAWHRNIVKGLARTRRASALVAVIERVRTWQDVDRGWFSRDEFHSLVTTMHRDLEAAAYLTGKVTIRKGLDKIMRSRASSGALARKYLKHADELLVWWGENETGVRKLAAQGKKLPYAQRPD